MKSHRTCLFRVIPFCAWTAALLCPACLTPAPSHVGSPDTELETILVNLKDVRGGSFQRDEGHVRSGEAAVEAQLTRELRALTLMFPRHVPGLVASASLAYERRDSVTAQKYLDQALVLEPEHLEATLLRVRIAAEAGNLPYARRKIGEQLSFAPDNADLREAHSGVLYLLGEYDLAKEELDVADRLRPDDAEVWRTNYHRGLIAEALGDLEQAQEFYRLSYEQNPTFEPAGRRFRWLGGQSNGSS